MVQFGDQQLMTHGHQYLMLACAQQIPVQNEAMGETRDGRSLIVTHVDNQRKFEDQRK